MKLNRLEKLMMNQPLRTPLVEYLYLGRHVSELDGNLAGKKVLEVGCGAGVWMETMLRYLGVAQVHAFDADPDMVKRAQKRLARYIPARVTLMVADVTRIPEEDASFDAVFDIAILHHVEDWRAALREISRVLCPGGFFYLEEVTRKGLEGWFNRTFFEHPQEDRFDTAELVAGLEKNGLWVESRQERAGGGYVMVGGHKAR
jgi:ubiquinone/menaquinone biosynthesis C-methylase UbiE